MYIFCQVYRRKAQRCDANKGGKGTAHPYILWQENKANKRKSGENTPGFSCQKSLAEFAARGGRKNSNHFPPGRVPGGKYFSGCKCGICPCLRTNYARSRLQTFCRKSPAGFFGRLKPGEDTPGFSCPDLVTDTTSCGASKILPEILRNSFRNHRCPRRKAVL